VNCIGDLLTLAYHPRRGYLVVDEAILDHVSQMWRLGIDVDSRESTHSFTRDEPTFALGDSRFEFRDREVLDSNPGLALPHSLAQHLLGMLEEVQPEISHRPRWVWRQWTQSNGPRSSLMLPQEDLPLLGQLMAKVETQTEGRLNLGLPLSVSNHFELNLQLPADLGGMSYHGFS
jgi:hypothetical protein